MRNEYDILFEQFKKVENVEEKNETYIDIIDALAKYDINIEIIGCWIWISGTNRGDSVIDVLKSLKFRWSPKKSMWYFAGSKTKSRGNYSMNDIKQIRKLRKKVNGTF